MTPACDDCQALTRSFRALSPLARPLWLRLDAARLRDPTMRPLESSPFWVWLTIGLMVFGGAAYVTSYFMIEDFMGFLK